MHLQRVAALSIKKDNVEKRTLKYKYKYKYKLKTDPDFGTEIISEENYNRPIPFLSHLGLLHCKKKE